MQRHHRRHPDQVSRVGHHQAGDFRHRAGFTKSPSRPHAGDPAAGPGHEQRIDALEQSDENADLGLFGLVEEKASLDINYLGRGKSRQAANTPQGGHRPALHLLLDEQR